VPPIKPMLANGLEWDQIPTKAAGYLMEPKLDGWRCVVHVENGRVELTSRTGKSFTEKVFDNLLEQFRSIGDNYVMDGELAFITNDVYLVSDYPATASVLGSLPSEAHRKQREYAEKHHRVLQFVAFDMLQAGGVPLVELPQGTRTHTLRSALRDVWKHQSTPDIAFVPQSPFFREDVYTNIVEAGGEGVVLKNPNAPYTPSKRPANVWYKIKKFETMDVIITGFTPGEGKYKDQIGAIEFSLWYPGEGEKPGVRKYIGKCSGIDDAMREDMTLNKQDYMYKVMEIRYFGQVGANSDGLRHPQFIRMRHDKIEEECFFGR
jgi:DNA ligase-1